MRPFLILLSCILLYTIPTNKYAYYMAYAAEYDLGYDLADFGYPDGDGHAVDSSYNSVNVNDADYYDGSQTLYSPSFLVKDYDHLYDSNDMYMDGDGSYDHLDSGYDDYDAYMDYDAKDSAYADYEPMEYYDSGFEPTDYDESEHSGYDDYSDSVGYANDQYGQYTDIYEPVEYGQDDYDIFYKGNELYGDDYNDYSDESYYPYVDYNGYNSHGDGLYDDYGYEHYSKGQNMDDYSIFDQPHKPYEHELYDTHNDHIYGTYEDLPRHNYIPLEHHQTKDYMHKGDSYDHYVDKHLHLKDDYDRWENYMPTEELHNYRNNYPSISHSPKPRKSRPMNRYDRYGKDQSSLVYVPKQDSKKDERITESYAPQTEVRFPHIGIIKKDSANSYPSYKSHKPSDRYEPYKSSSEDYLSNSDWSKSKVDVHYGNERPFYNDYTQKKQRKSYKFEDQERTPKYHTDKKRGYGTKREYGDQKSLSDQPYRKSASYKNYNEEENRKYGIGMADFERYEKQNEREFADYKNSKNDEYMNWVDIRTPKKSSERSQQNGYLNDYRSYDRNIYNQDTNKYTDRKYYGDVPTDVDEGADRKLVRKENYRSRSGFKGAGKFLSLGIHEKDASGKHKTHYGAYDTQGTVKQYGGEKSQKRHAFEGTLASAGKADDYEDVYGKRNKKNAGGAIRSVSYVSTGETNRRYPMRFDEYRSRTSRRDYYGRD